MFWAEVRRGFEMERARQERASIPADEHPFEAAAYDKPFFGRKTVALMIARKNPRRWKRLQSDLRWVQKEMEIMGRNPEDFRWVI